MSTKTRRSYTETFKEEAVCLVRESGQPVTHVARDLGIADHRLYRWRAEQQHAEGQGQTRNRHGPNRRNSSGCDVLREGVAMRYRVIQEHDRRYPIRCCAGPYPSRQRAIMHGVYGQRVPGRCRAGRPSQPSG